MISFNETSQTFHLSAADVSYVIGIYKNRTLLHAYWGEKLQEPDLSYLWENPWEGASFDPVYQRLNLEYPTGERGDHRAAACKVRTPYGDTVTQFTYQCYEILPGKPGLKGLPATYAEADGEAETLVLHTLDTLTGLKADLYYTIFAETGAIARSAVFENTSGEALTLLNPASASVDFYDTNWQLMHLWGGHAIERTPQRMAVPHGDFVIASDRGASGHEHNPFAALMAPNATETGGSVYGFSLVYSGSFAIHAGCNSYETTRLIIGLNECAWKLEPGETFTTPEAVLVYGGQGLNSMSRKYHTLYRTRLCRGVWRDRVRPVIINNWEGTYFDFDEEKLLAIADRAQEIGCEMFVLDDGWFGKRNNDDCSLGDWVVNREKLPSGITGVANAIHERGMQFGLWFEPEMVSPDSDLYRAHPDWCLHVPGRDRTECRQQLILDLSRVDVQDYIIKAVSDVLEESPIEYVKWDMNRNFTESGSAALRPDEMGSLHHRYMLGLYRVLEEITSRFPKVLFESCSGGGGRFDPGMLYYMPQTWTSDDTDAIERTRIQYATSIVYPISAISAHVSATPSETNRREPMEFRCGVALSGNYGYELDLSKLSREDLDIAAESIRLVKEIRGLTQQGRFDRILSPFEQGYAAWQFLAPDGSEVLACVFADFINSKPPILRLKLQGLEDAAVYRDEESGRCFSGSVLTHVGIPMPRLKDGQCKLLRLKKV